MSTRLMGFDDPLEDIERELSRDSFADFDHLLSHLAPQLGVPLIVSDTNTAASASNASAAGSGSGSGNGSGSAGAGAGADAKQGGAATSASASASASSSAGSDEKQVAQAAPMDVDSQQPQQSVWLSAYSRAPALDVVERDKDFQVNVDVPGVNKEDIKLQITEDRRGRKLLTVSGERKEEKNAEDKQRGYRSTHRLYGHFSRSLRLPETCDTKSGSIQAKHENGVLKITLPKLNPEALKPQGVDIKID